MSTIIITIAIIAISCTMLIMPAAAVFSIKANNAKGRRQR